MKNNWGRGNQKRGDLQKENGKPNLIELSLGIEKDKN